MFKEVNRSIQPVILAAGSGTHLWPLSRQAYPKQFVPLVDGRSLFALTLERLTAVTRTPPLVVANETRRFMAAEGLRSDGQSGASIVLEPEGRNTAPAIGLAAYEARASGADASYLHAEHRLVATMGLIDCVVVETANAVLVAPSDRAQEVKYMVEQLGSANGSEGETHRRVYRPWGSYEGPDTGERYQVKRIIVDPGGRLSLQMHHHRAEHWVVVRGGARVTHRHESYLLSENQSAYIPIGTVHRLENPGQNPTRVDRGAVGELFWRGRYRVH